MKVYSEPNPLSSQSVGGITTVVEAYGRYAKEHDIEFVRHPSEADLYAAHAGIYIDPVQLGIPIVSHVHGLYFGNNVTRGYEAVNEKVIKSVQYARISTVPSAWVAEMFQRDMHYTPEILPHGVDWDRWQGGSPQGYVIGYAKNRAADACDPSFMAKFARMFPRTRFYSTFAKGEPFPENVRVTGRLPYDAMRDMVLGADVYINTTEETFGIGALEAMAAGVPVLSYNWGGLPDFIKHGVNGYLAQPGNLDDLAAGLAYCLEHRAVLGANGRQLATQYTWHKAMEKLRSVYDEALRPSPVTVGVTVTAYNKDASLVERAVGSVAMQTLPAKKIVLVDDGSEEEYSKAYRAIAVKYDAIYVGTDNSGVARARNYGHSICGDVKYLCSLDGDDWIEDNFLQVCVGALEQDPSKGIAYTKLTGHRDGKSTLSSWPSDNPSYDEQLKRKNQVPTTCVVRRDIFVRTGGYRSRYCPDGAGSEDAELWTRFGALGYWAVCASKKGLFNYTLSGGTVTGNPNYREVDWLDSHPYSFTGRHPFASAATRKPGSHLPLRYSLPRVSVIVPVAPYHLFHLWNSLDSVEAQTYRNWELIVVLDSDQEIPQAMLSAYPYVNWLSTGKASGPAKARNLGAANARGNLLLFLDADDTLTINAISAMVNAYDRTGKAVYGDYYAVVSDDRRLPGAEKLGRGLSLRKAKEYSRSLAAKMPSDPLYLWCNVTTLVPKAWHDAIGGFDEVMQSWEDVLYWWKMSWSGYQFEHISEGVMVYNYDSGEMRAKGIQNKDALIQYILQEKEKCAKAATEQKDNRGPR